MQTKKNLPKNQKELMAMASEKWRDDTKYATLAVQAQNIPMKVPRAIKRIDALVERIQKDVNEIERLGGHSLCLFSTDVRAMKSASSKGENFLAEMKNLQKKFWIHCSGESPNEKEGLVKECRQILNAKYALFTGEDAPFSYAAHGRGKFTVCGLPEGVKIRKTMSVGHMVGR